MKFRKYNIYYNMVLSCKGIRDPIRLWFLLVDYNTSESILIGNAEQEGTEAGFPSPSDEPTHGGVTRVVPTRDES